MVRPILADEGILGDCLEAVLGCLLQGGFIIPIDQLPRVGDNQRGKEPAYKNQGFIEAAIQIQGGNYGFKGIGQQGILLSAAGDLLPLAQKQIIAETEAAGQFDQRLFTHHRSPEFRKLSFRIGGKGLHEQIADAKLQHRIAQKLQPFIVLHGQKRIFVDKRTVDQSIIQERQILPTVI